MGEKLLDTPRGVRKSGREGEKREEEAEEHRSFRRGDVSEMSHFYRNSPVSGAFAIFLLFWCLVWLSNSLWPTISTDWFLAGLVRAPVHLPNWPIFQSHQCTSLSGLHYAEKVPLPWPSMIRKVARGPLLCVGVTQTMETSRAWALLFHHAL